MKKVILVFITLFFFQFINSQQKTIDSLNRELSEIKNDSLLLNVLSEKVSFYRNRNSDVHFFLANKGIKQSSRLKKAKVEANFIRELGIYYRKKGSLDSAIINYDKAINKFAFIKDSIGVYSVKSSLANVYKAKGNYPGAIKTFKETISFFEGQGNNGRMRLLITKFNLAGVYQEMLDWGTTDKLLEEIYNDSLVKTNKALLRSLYINLTGSKQKVGQLEKALEYGKLAEKTETRPRSLANLYINIGSIYEKQKKHQEAHDYYLKTLQIFTKLNSDRGIQMALNNLGNNSVYWEKYKQAEGYLLKSNALLEKGDNLKSLRYNYDMLSSLYENMGDYKKSLSFYRKNQSIKDSILGIEKQTAISDIEIKYDTEKAKREKEVAEKQVAITKLESQKNKSLFLGSLIIAFLIFLASLFYFKRLKTKKKAELVSIELKETQKRLAIEKQYRDSELKALKAQMNPHFIFNALNSIQDYIVLNQKNLASDYLGKFADLIRNYLHFSDTGFISISDEVHNLNLYLELEKLRFEEQFEYKFDIEESANSDVINIPTMLIQPYVENALKHGLLHKKSERKLHISISKISNKIIECIIEDNGIGREKSKEINMKREAQHKSFALNATTERLDLLNFGRVKKIGVTFVDLKDNDKAVGTKVILKIPIIKK
ncbi:histidine kinase [Psychroserpens sp.]|uniref:histidine kinase n=1 Tax=Psychroserpens sp. TaxID=2020870 RepID=UPI00385F9466